MTNEYGLDVSYYQRKLERVLAGIDRYTPDELARELVRMAVTADQKVLSESEFSTVTIVKNTGPIKINF